MHQEKIRAFIAISLAKEVEQNLGQIQAKLKNLQETGRLRASIPKASNIHLTLQFLGDIDEVLLAAIGEKIAALKADLQPFTIEARGVGAFPNLGKPKVIWAGIKMNEELKELYRRIRTGLKGLPMKLEDKPFRPHLTLARIKQGKAETIQQTLKPHLQNHFGATTVERFFLFQSELTQKGAIYTPRIEWRLDT